MLSDSFAVLSDLLCCACCACADIKTADWSEEVAPFWGEVIKTAFTAEGISGLLKAGWTTIKGALVSRGVC